MEIKYENKYIAFLDVLGFSALVEKKDQEKLEIYFFLIDEAFKAFDSKIKHVTKLIISDSIILTANDTDENFLDLITAISALQATLAVSGIWIRGGVSFGEVFCDDKRNIIVGKGYIKAYLLEQQAIYPRVIIDPVILSKMNVNRQEFYKKYNSHTYVTPLKSKKVHDYDFDKHKRYTQDDAIFICYANLAIVHALKRLGNKDLEQTYHCVKHGLYGEQKHYHKYLWLRKYFLECLEEFDSYTDTESPNKPVLKKYIEDFTAL
ncbi:MAG TPA: hypothetical protein VNX01_15815 [Bacteroidia bacterium]|jgi:hypothetical protein|nr:hypothetical protein [Bacteroidia bacterium]